MKAEFLHAGPQRGSPGAAAKAGLFMVGAPFLPEPLPRFQGVHIRPLIGKGLVLQGLDPVLEMRDFIREGVTHFPIGHRVGGLEAGHQTPGGIQGSGGNPFGLGQQERAAAKQDVPQQHQHHQQPQHEDGPQDVKTDFQGVFHEESLSAAISPAKPARNEAPGIPWWMWRLHPNSDS